MRFSLQPCFGLALLAAIVSGGAVQALPPVWVQEQAKAGRAVFTNALPDALPNALPNTLAASANRDNPVYQSILTLTNQARSEQNRGSVRLSDQLNAAAQRHADDLASGAPFSHTGSDGSKMVNRVKDAGYAYLSIAENIYAQSPRNRPSSAVQGWLRSPGHRRNLLNGKFTEMGVGYATDGTYHYYVQVFGKPQLKAKAQQPELAVEPKVELNGEPTTDIAVSTAPSSSVPQSILALTNQARAQSNQGSLRLSNQLNAAAQRHANDLASGAPFSHTGSDGSKMVDRVKDAGYAYRSLAENIYSQSPSNRPENAVQGWLNSPGHRRNLLSGKYTDMGVGYATDGRSHYYVQVFGKPQ